jgi:hypothetical protein
VEEQCGKTSGTNPLLQQRWRTRSIGRNSGVKLLLQRKGESFAKAYISTAAPPPLEDSRVPFTHEDQGRPQSACGAPQEGTSSPYTRVAQASPPGTRNSRGRRGWCAGEILTPYTARENAAPVPTSPCLFAAMNLP